MIETEQNEQGFLVRPSGTISVTTADELRGALHEAVEGGATTILIDLADVDMIDSTGLSVFVQCYKTLADRSGELVVLTDKDEFTGLFKLMRLDQHFSIRRAA